MSLCSFLGILWAFWIWICLSIPRLETFSAIISSGKFSAPFSFWNPYKVNVGLLDIVSWFFLAVFTLFSLFLFAALIFWFHCFVFEFTDPPHAGGCIYSGYSISWQSILYLSLYPLIPYPWIASPHFPLTTGNHSFIFCICESGFFVCLFVFCNTN